MNAHVVWGLLLQAVSLGVMFAAFGRATLRRVGPYFLFSAVVYHGVTEVVQAVTGSSRYRGFTTQASIDRWLPIIGWVCLLFTVFYVVASRRRAHPAVDVEAERAAFDRILRVFDWRILAVFTVPLLLIVARGGYHYGDLTNYKGTVAASSGLAAQFFDIAVSLTTISFVAKHPRGFVAAILLELAAVVMVGSRNDLIVVFACTLFGLAILRRRPQRRAVIAVVILAGFVVLAINSTREIYGRDAYNNASSLGTRLTLIVHGAFGVFGSQPATYQGQSQPLGERLDGNSFPAAELDGMRKGVHPVGLTTARNDLMLAVPSVLNPGKLSGNVLDRSEKGYLANHFEVGYTGDFIPTQFGAMLGYFGVGGLLILAALFGALYGWLDRKLLAVSSPTRYVAVIALLICALSYPTPLDVYPITARGAVTLLLLMTVLDRLRPRVAARRQRRTRPAAIPRSTLAPAGTATDPVVPVDELSPAWRQAFGLTPRG